MFLAFILLQAGGRQGGITLFSFLPFILLAIIIYFFIIRPLRKRRLIEQGKVKPMNQSNKRIMGIILSSIGGLGTLIFGLSLVNASNRIYLLRSQAEQAMITYGVLTGFSVLVLIIGIIMILSAKNVKEIPKDDPEEIENKNNLEKLEKLAEFRDKKVITEEEFQSQKRKILSS